MGAGIRPLSARNRSTSNLEVIHEVVAAEMCCEINLAQYSSRLDLQNTSHLAEARRIASSLPISPIPENCTYIRYPTLRS